MSGWEALSMRSSGSAPRSLRFESQLAVRHLRAGGQQTLLTISAVAAG